ncbi:hypothetical protein ACLOJK_015512 [Asimina triloba]
MQVHPGSLDRFQSRTGGFFSQPLPFCWLPLLRWYHIHLQRMQYIVFHPCRFSSEASCWRREEEKSGQGMENPSSSLYPSRRSLLPLSRSFSVPDLSRHLFPTSSPSFFST